MLKAVTAEPMNARRNRLMRPVGFLALDGDVRFLGVDLFLGMRRHCRRAWGRPMISMATTHTCGVAANCNQKMISSNLNAKHRRTLRAVFATPTSPKILFGDVLALFVAVGGHIREGEGSRVVLELSHRRLYLRRPHPGKEAKRYQVEALRALLESEGVSP